MLVRDGVCERFAGRGEAPATRIGRAPSRLPNPVSRLSQPAFQTGTSAPNFQLSPPSAHSSFISVLLGLRCNLFVHSDDAMRASAENIC